MTAPNRKLAKPAGALALILAGVYAVEGGYVNDKRDPGGATNYGVTQQVARQHGYKGDMRLFPKHCDGPAHACADSVYVADYIAKPGYLPLVEIEPAVADKLVNIAVNMGPGRPNRWYRESVGLPSSAAPLTSGDISAYRFRQMREGVGAACRNTLLAIATRQEAEYRRLISNNPRLSAFQNGWLKRARNLHPGGIKCGAA